MQEPNKVVRAYAAKDCVRLAENCLSNAHSHVIVKTPFKYTSAHDRLFTMKSAKFQEMLKTEDFWWYYISRMEAGQHDIAEAVFEYEQDHIKTGTPFRAAQ